MLLWKVGATGQTELTWERDGSTLVVEWITIDNGC
jgi:hypothetical protein